MAFGYKEDYNDKYISYTSSVDLLLADLKMIGYKDLTKNKLMDIFENKFSINGAVKKSIVDILDKKIKD